MGKIPLEIRLARDYARLSYESPTHPLLSLVKVEPKIRRQVQKMFVEGKTPKKLLPISLAFDFKEYASGINYFGDNEEVYLEDLEQEDFEDLMDSYLSKVETEWNRAICQSRSEHLVPFVSALRELDSKNPLLLCALYDVNGELRTLDYRRTKEFFELSANERNVLWDREGVGEDSYLLVNYLNALAGEIKEIYERNKSDLITLLELFKETKSQ